MISIGTFSKRYPGLASIARNGGWHASSELALYALRVVYILAISRMLGPEGYGFLAYALTFYISFLPLIQLGMDAQIPLEIGRLGKGAAPLASRIFSLRCVLASMVALIAMLIALLSEPSPAQQLGLVIACAALIPRSLQQFCAQVFSGAESAKQNFRLQVSFRAIEICLGIAALAFFQADANTLIVLHLVTLGAQVLYALRLIHRRYLPLVWRWQPHAWLQLLRGDNLWIAGQVLIFFLLSNSVFLLYRHLVEDAAVFGQVALAYQAVNLALACLAALLAGSVPVMVRSYARGDGKDHVFSVASGAVMFVCGWLVVALLEWFGAPLVRLMIGPEYPITAERIAAMAYWLPWALSVQPLQRYLFVRKCFAMVITNYFVGWLVAMFVLFAHSVEAQIADALIHAMQAGFMTAVSTACITYSYVYLVERAAQKP